jgi:hypothetical protein
MIKLEVKTEVLTSGLINIKKYDSDIWINGGGEEIICKTITKNGVTYYEWNPKYIQHINQGATK